MVPQQNSNSLTARLTVALLFTGTFSSFLPIMPLPVAELLLCASFVTLLGERVLRKSLPETKGTAPLLFFGCCWLLLTLLPNPPSSLSVIKGTLQPVLAFYVAISVFRNHAFAASALLRRLLSCLWLASVLFCICQQISGIDLTEASAGFGSRAIYSMCIILVVPVLLETISDLPHEFAQKSLIILAVLAGLLSLTYLPAFVAYIIVVFTWAALRPNLRMLLPICLSCSALVILIFTSPDAFSHARRTALTKSVALEDAKGYARRWQLELRAGLRAIKDRPLTGHGPGMYQTVVSSSEYRSNLGMTLENRVKEDTQPGFLVLAVEYGLPGVLLFIAAFTTILIRSTGSNKTSGGFEIGLLGFLCSGFFTVPLSMGVELLPGLLAGCTLRKLDLQADLSKRDLSNNFFVQGIVLTVCFLIGLSSLLGTKAGTDDSNQTKQSNLDNNALKVRTPARLIEIERCEYVPEIYDLTKDKEASEGLALSLGNVSKELMHGLNRQLTYEIEAAEAGTYKLWLRVWWRDGCSNSAALQIDNEASLLMGNDGLYKKWHWVSSPAVELSEGNHQLRLIPREAHVKLDTLAVLPTGFMPPQEQQDFNGGANLSELDWLDTSEPNSEKEFCAAIGGVYANGPESIMLRMGIPYERLRYSEIADYNALKPYEVIWLSGPKVSNQAKLWQALHQYVDKGGTLIFELPPHVSTWHSESLQALLPHLARRRNKKTPYGGRSIKANGSEWFKYVTEDLKLHQDVIFESYKKITSKDGKLHGSLGYSRQAHNHVGLERQVGEGRVFHLMTPVGFASMWRGPALDNLARGIMEDAINGRYQPLYKELTETLAHPKGLQMADDFMRLRGKLETWQSAQGAFHLTGGRGEIRRAKDSQPNEAPFVLYGNGKGVAISKGIQAQHYRISASVNAEDGVGGIWSTTEGGTRISLVYDGTANKLTLSRQVHNSEITPLATVSPKGNAKGWRRMSLLQRKQHWEGWLDGQLKLRAPKEEDEETIAPFGFIQAAGTVMYDDLQIVDTAAILPHTDRAYGEEGSSFSLSKQTSGIETRSIYSPAWLIRPSPQSERVLKPELPIFETGLLSINDIYTGKLPPSRNIDTQFALPNEDNEQVAIERLGLATACWHDYNFEDQLTDWYSTGTEWTRIPRWACDRKWEWFGVRTGAQPAMLWYRPQLKPHFAANILWVPVTPEKKQMDHERSRDLNLIIGGNGEDLNEGYRIVTGIEKRFGVRLYQGKKLISETSAIGLPLPRGLALHHIWLKFELVVFPKRIQLYIQDDLALDATLEQEIPAGQLGLWTIQNNIQIGKATISHPISRN